MHAKDAEIAQLKQHTEELQQLIIQEEVKIMRLEKALNPAR